MTTPKRPDREPDYVNSTASYILEYWFDEMVCAMGGPDCPSPELYGMYANKEEVVNYNLTSMTFAPAGEFVQRAYKGWLLEKEIFG